MVHEVVMPQLSQFPILFGHSPCAAMSRVEGPHAAAYGEAAGHQRRSPLQRRERQVSAVACAREDKAGHTAAVLRNWEFFRAPLAAIVCMHRDLGPADALSVGMFLQTLLLALTERGLGSCVEVSISGYPEIIRAQLAIPTELSILCGLAIGYPDPEFPANKLHIAREPVGENVVFLDN